MDTKLLKYVALSNYVVFGFFLMDVVHLFPKKKIVH